MTEKSYPYLDENGSVVTSPVTLVAHLDLRPITLGERISRYMRTPKFQQDMNNTLGFDDGDDVPDDMVDMDDLPLSKHEDRARVIQDRARRRRFEEKEAEKKANFEKAKAEKEAFRQRYQEIKDEIDNKSPPLFPDNPDAPQRASSSRTEA